MITITITDMTTREAVAVLQHFQAVHQVKETEAQVDGPATAPTQTVPTQPTASVPVTPVTPVPTAPPPTFSRGQIMTAGAALVSAGKQAELIALLHTFGVQAVTQIPDAQLGAFATEMRKIGAAI
ncbi:MAG: hypothetical protein FWF10_00495 [Clostridiales bacterium]|nr:hypothetical protein [Clostridiales bacterium]